MKKEHTTFGELLRKLRLEEAKMGLRAFADLIEMAPSNLSNIERDRIMPPAGKKKLQQISDALGLAQDNPNRQKLFDLSATARSRVPADVEETIKENKAIPILVRTVANKQLDEKELIELTEFINKHY